MFLLENVRLEMQLSLWFLCSRRGIGLVRGREMDNAEKYLRREWVRASTDERKKMKLHTVSRPRDTVPTNLVMVMGQGMLNWCVLMHEAEKFQRRGVAYATLQKLRPIDTGKQRAESSTGPVGVFCKITMPDCGRQTVQEEGRGRSRGWRG